MKVNIKTNNIKKILPILLRNTEKDSLYETKDILYIEVRDNNVVFRVVSRDTGLEYKITSSTIKKGCICVNLTHFVSIIESIEEGELTLETNKELKIYSTKNISKLTQISTEEFPTIPELEKPKEISFEKEIFIEGIQKTMHSIAKGINKPEFSGVFIYTKENKIIFVSTDVKRLAEFKKENKEIKEDIKFILPNTSIQKLLSVLNLIEGKIKIFITENSIIIKNNNTTFYSRLINGNFPPYKQLFPSKNLEQIEVNKNEILKFLRKGKIFADKYNSVVIQIIENEMKLSFVHENIGETEEVIIIKTDNKNSYKTHLNYMFLEDSLKNIIDNNILITFSKDNTIYSPILFTGKENKEFSSLIVPLQV